MSDTIISYVPPVKKEAFAPVKEAACAVDSIKISAEDRVLLDIYYEALALDIMAEKVALKVAAAKTVNIPNLTKVRDRSVDYNKDKKVDGGEAFSKVYDYKAFLQGIHSKMSAKAKALFNSDVGAYDKAKRIDHLRSIQKILDTKSKAAQLTAKDKELIILYKEVLAVDIVAETLALKVAAAKTVNIPNLTKVRDRNVDYNGDKKVDGGEAFSKVYDYKAFLQAVHSRFSAGFKQAFNTRVGIYAADKKMPQLLAIRALLAAQKPGFCTAIHSIDPTSILQGANPIKMTVKGRAFPEGAQVVFLIEKQGNKVIDPYIKVSQIQRKADGKEITFQVQAIKHQDSPPGKRFVRISGVEADITVDVGAVTCDPTTSVTPDSVKKGETKEITVSVACGKLPLNPNVTITPKGVEISNIRRINDTTIKFTATVPKDAEVGTRTMKVLDGNTLIAQKDFKIAEKTDGKDKSSLLDVSRRTVGQYFNIFNRTNTLDINGRDMIRFDVGGGYQHYPSGADIAPLAGHLGSYLLMDLAFGTSTSPIPIYAFGNAGYAIYNERRSTSVGFELAAHVRGNFSLLYPDYLGSVGFGLHPRITLGPTFIEGYASFLFSGAHYRDPAIGFPNGITYGLNGLGTAFGWRSDIHMLRVFYEYRTSRTKTDDDPTVHTPFSGVSQDHRLGARLNLTLSRLGDHWAYPDIALACSVTAYGASEKAGLFPGPGTYATRTAGSFDLEAMISAPNWKGFGRPYIRGGFSQTIVQHLEDWEPSRRYSVGVGFRFRNRDGRLDLSYVGGKNLSIFNGGDQHAGRASFRLPWYSPVSVSAEGGTIGGKGYGAFQVKFDIFRAIFR